MFVIVMGKKEIQIGDIIVPEVGYKCPNNSEFRAHVVRVSEDYIVVRFINAHKGNTEKWPYDTYQVVGRIYA